jgi:hypothetical protein
VGLDDKSLDGSVPRILTFEIDGPSLIHAAVSDASGQVQLCVWREAVDDERTCLTGRNVVIDHTVTDSGSGLWHVSMIGGKGVTPSAALTLDFNANAPSVQLNNFRFYGTSNAAYNGFTAAVDTGAGLMPVQFAFDDGEGGSYDYHLLIKQTGGAPIVDTTGGPSTSYSADPVPAIDAGSYSVTVEDPDPIANPGLAVFITATIGWP